CERRQFSDQLVQGGGGVGGFCPAGRAWCPEQGLLSAGGVGQGAYEFAGLLPDLGDPGVPGACRERRWPCPRRRAVLPTCPVCPGLAGSGAVSGVASAVGALTGGKR